MTQEKDTQNTAKRDALKQKFRDAALEAEIDPEDEILDLPEEEFRTRRYPNGDLDFYPLELEEICAWTASGWLRSALYPICGRVTHLTPETQIGFFARMTLPPGVLIDTFNDIFERPIDQATVLEHATIRDVVSEALFGGNRPKEPVVEQYPAKKERYHDEESKYFDQPF